MKHINNPWDSVPIIDYHFLKGLYLMQSCYVMSFQLAHSGSHEVRKFFDCFPFVLALEFDILYPHLPKESVCIQDH